MIKELQEIRRELARAEQLHPVWPEDLIHQVAIMTEEAGESMQAALNSVYHGAPKALVREELIQTGAMVLRCLKNFEGEK